jgi:hypothetical protein
MSPTGVFAADANGTAWTPAGGPELDLRRSTRILMPTISDLIGACLLPDVRAGSGR